MTPDPGQRGLPLTLPRTRRAGLLGRFVTVGVATTMVVGLAAVPSWAEEPTPIPQTTAPPPSSENRAVDKVLEAAKSKAAKSGKRVEIPERNTETTTLYANPDGKTLRFELSAQPVRVKNADGKGFTPINTTLVEVDGVIKPKAAPSDLVLSAGRDKILLKSRVNDTGAATGDATAKISTPSDLPEPRLKGNAATYPGAYGKGLDLVVTANATGFRQHITIAERPTGTVSFRVPMQLPEGLSFKRNAAGRPVIAGKDGKTLTEIRPTLLQDAKATDVGAPLDSGRTGKAAVLLADDGKTLVFTPDAAFLADPATTYPVTLTAAASDWWEGHTGQWGLDGGAMDTWINDYDYQDSWDTFTQTQIVVGKSYASNIAKRWRGYLKFPDIPAEFAGSEVENADLHLWNYQSNECGISVGTGITARRITSAWDETRLLWNSQPSVTSTGADTELGAYSEDCTGSMNYAWDLTHTLNGIVQDWIDGETNYGIQLTAGNESELRNWRRYTSEDAGGCTTSPLEECKGQLHPPILTVDFLLPEPVAMKAIVYRGLEQEGPLTAEEAAQYKGNLTDNPPPLPAISDEQATIAAQENEGFTEASPGDVTVPADMPPEQVEADVDPNIPPFEKPAESDVRAHWNFDEGEGSIASDSSEYGYEHDATLGSTARWTGGKSGQALSNVPSQARAAAAKQAATKGTAVEVVDETTATSITRAQPGGKTFTTEITAGPVRTKQSGKWVQIDTSLSEREGTLKPKAIAAGVAVEFSTGGTAPFVKMSADGKSYALRWPTPLPKPIIKGSVATYTDAVGVGADLVVTALPTGFRHEVVLRQRPAKPVGLRIGVEDEGLTLSEGRGGQLLLKGKDKKLVAAGTRPVMSDGGVKDRPASVKHAKAGSDVVTKGGRTELVVKPDQAFLADAGTIYPVRVAAVVTLPLSADVDTSMNDSEGWPALPDNPVMLAGTMTGGTKARVHLQFDTAGVQGSTVTDATLSMNTIDSHNCGAALANGIQVARLTGAWDPANLYWANKPAHTTEDASTNFKGVDQNCDTYPDSMDWNVTGIAQDWAAGAANHGLVLKSPGEANINNYRVFTSSEETDFNLPPKLTITTSGTASQPAVSAPAITPAQTVDGVTVTSSLTPQLTATVSDTAGGNLTGEFEVEHDPAATTQGTGQIWAGASPVVTSGGQATVGVPAGKLTDGWKIRWRVRAANTAMSTTSAWSDWQTAAIKLPEQGSDPSVGALQVVPSTMVNGQTITSSLTPALLAQVSDPAGGKLRAEFEVEHDPVIEGQGSGQIWAGAIDNVASGTQASLTVPQGTLTDGWNVRWRARAVAGEVSSAWSDWQTLSIDTAPTAPEPLARTSEPAIYTDDSFTVAAWLRWSDKDGNYTVVEQRGVNQAPFHLGNTPDHGLEFTFTSADSTEATVEGVLSDVEPPVNEWFHLSGVYDEATKKASLYLNGGLVKSETLSFASWNAETITTLGTSMLGDLDDVWIYSRALTDNEVAVSAGITSASGPLIASKTSKKAVTSTANPAPAMVYSRILNVDECQKSKLSKYEAPKPGRPAKNPLGYTKNHFSWCAQEQMGLTYENEDTGALDSLAGLDVVIIGRTFQNERTMEFDVHIIKMEDDLPVNPFFGSQHFEGKSFTLGMQATGSPSNAACKQVVGNGYQQTYAGKEEYWNSVDKVTFKFESPTPTAGGWTSNTDEDIAICNMALTIDAPHADTEATDIGVKWTIRCDSASYITWWKQGCIFKHVTPSVVLKQTQFPNAYAHIYNAFKNPSATTPQAGGPRYTWPKHMKLVSPPHKQFPGFSKFTPLHRLRDENRIDRNRDRSESICARYKSASLPAPNTGKWRSNQPVPWDSTVEQCDEYPFASTYEGSWTWWQDPPPQDSGITYPAKKVNISAKLIPAKENREWGAFQDGGVGRYYSVDRILAKDPFFLRLYDAQNNLVK